MSIIFITEDIFKLGDLNVVIRAESLNQKFGLIKNLEEHFTCEIKTDGNVVLFSCENAMEFVREFENGIYDFLEEYKLKESIDYVNIMNLEASKLNLDLFYRFYLRKPIRTIVGCRWLDSIVLIEGHYVWFKETLKTQNHIK